MQKINPDDVVEPDDLAYITDENNPAAIDPEYDEGADPYAPLDFEDAFEDDVLRDLPFEGSDEAGYY